jgi:hypothetical protein
VPESNPLRPDLLGSEIATPVLWLLAAVLLVAWFASHRFKDRFTTKPLQFGYLVGRIILGMVALWALYQAASRALVLESTWPLWGNAFIGALAIEFAMVVYQLEKKLITPRLGKWLLALRVASIATILTILIQPVFARDTNRQIERKVVVLVDDSGSMGIADPQMTVAEKMSLANFYGLAALKDRPQLEPKFTALETSVTALDKTLGSLTLPEGFGAEAEASLLTEKKDAISAAIKELQANGEALSTAVKEAQNLPEDAKQVVAEIERNLREGFKDRLTDATQRLDQMKLADLQSSLKQAREIGSRVTARAPFLTDAVDQVFYQKVSPEARKEIDELALKTRAKLAAETMERPRVDGGNKSLTALLQEKYGVQIMRFGKKSSEVADFNFPASGEDQEFRLRTDLTSALTKISETYPQENLAGVLLLSDCRHNTDTPTNDVVRKMGTGGSPIVPVLIGSAKGSKDASILAVNGPQAMYEGDRIRTKVDLKADGLRGQKVKVRLLQDGTEVATQEVTVPEDSYRTTIRLVYQPKVAGIFAHKVVIDPIEGELFKNNNEWGFQTAVSEDRTTVLLVEDRPRWEFRYLRNLFDSRDKSVHLQYVLLHPDDVEGATNETKMASAGAKFGDSEATVMPEKLEDWKKFDVIILGDIPPASLGAEKWKIISECVSQRGAMLVMIAGPNSMPHAYTNDVFKELCPVLYEANTASMLAPPEPAYRLMLTAEGRQHLMFQQSKSTLETNRIWESMPLLRWRHTITGVKPTASVLAYAQPAKLDAGDNEIPQASVSASLDPAALSKQKASEAKNALVVTSQYGSGKVAMLNFDHTWRFRYGVGDTYHHRFWGQLLRWGAGENLRAGTELVRLGTDNLTYEPGEKISIVNKLIEQDYRPVTEATTTATVYRGTEKVAQKKLTFQADSPGIYEGFLDSLTEPGDYSLELSGSDVDRLAAGTAIKTKFTIASAVNPVEFGDLTTNAELANRLATDTNGVVLTPASAIQALEKFGPAATTKAERKETKLWDNWIILVGFLGMITSEWIARRRGGLI